MQVHTLIYPMGDVADDIVKYFYLMEEEMKTYNTVKDEFDNHFVKRHNNVISMSERALISVVRNTEKPLIIL